jgi:hypothetical protein
MRETPTGHDGAGRYQLRLEGHLEPRWAAWFDDLTLTTHRDGTTTIAGHVLDQAALHGLLQKVRDVGLPLISVNRVDPDQPGDTTSALQQSLTIQSKGEPST